MVVVNRGCFENMFSLFVEEETNERCKKDSTNEFVKRHENKRARIGDKR